MMTLLCPECGSVLEDDFDVESTSGVDNIQSGSTNIIESNN